MLRFAEKSLKELVKYLFEIRVNLSADANDVEVSQVFPSEKAEPGLLKSIQLFAFPHPSAVEQNSFFYFVIGDTAVDFQLGFIQYGAEPSGLCIISDFFYPDLFKSLLSYEKSKIISLLNDPSIVPTDGQIKFDKLEFLLDGSDIQQKLLSQVFYRFSPFDISRIIIGMLQARHVFPISSSASNISSFSAALPLLISPFRWDLNIIPVLPMKLKDMTQIPVPTMIGLTHAELLKEGRVAPHVLVNIDTGFAYEYPPFDQNSPDRIKVLMLQLSFHKSVCSILESWKDTRAFPHKLIWKETKRFIFQYLQVFTGVCQSSKEFLSRIGSFPEHLSTSQVLHDLENYSKIPQSLKSQFELWFEEVIGKGTKLAPKIRQPTKSSSEINLSIKDKPIPNSSGQIKTDKSADFDPFGTSSPITDDLISFSSSNQKLAAQKTDNLIDFLDAPPVSNKTPSYHSPISKSNTSDFSALNKKVASTPPPKQAQQDDLLDFF